MQMAMAARSAAEVDAALQGAIDERQAAGDAAGALNLSSALDLWRATPGAFATIKAVLETAQHDAATGRVDHWSAVFDRLAEISPPAGVALYSLGRRDILDAATDSICERLRTWRLIGPHAAVLDLGCGSGRVLRAIAPHVRMAAGLDISGGMLRAARQACRGLANVGLVQGSGADLAMFRDETFDLVCAVDVLPYLVADRALTAGVLREARRVLRPGGSLVILNYAYRGDPAADRADVRRLAAEDGWSVVRLGTADFAHWDGLTFHLRRRA
jgi:SAM-dependent methyltransferase